jgi:DNA-binding NarL/FixJ family response regulator
LWEGGHSIARVVDADGKRLFVLRRRPPPAAPKLTRAEARVVEHALQGAALKAIAADLGTTVSTASAQLQRALEKLGLKDRAELSRMFAAVPASA